MRRAQLQAGRFSTVHIRLSPEKAKEVAQSGRVMPTVEGYSVLALAVARSTGYHRVFVQTANPGALLNFSQLCRSKIKVSYTNNPRTDHDSWGGWVNDTDVISQQAAAGAVNAHIASHAAVLISPSISIWTIFLGYLMEAGKGNSRRPSKLFVTSYLCKAPHKRLRTGYLRVVVRADHIARARLGLQAQAVVAPAMAPASDSDSAGEDFVSTRLPHAVNSLSNLTKCSKVG